MPVFAYEGRTASGETKKGEVEAADQDAARSRLRAMQISPTKVKAKGGLGGGLSMPQFDFLKPKVTTKDLVIFVRQFATMIDSGLPLVQCLEIQASQATNPTLREQLAVIKAATDRVVDEILETDAQSFSGSGPSRMGKLPLRYSFGGVSGSGHFVHDPAWRMLIDLPTTTPILRAIFRSDDYYCGTPDRVPCTQASDRELECSYLT